MRKFLLIPVLALAAAAPAITITPDTYDIDLGTLSYLGYEWGGSYSLTGTVVNDTASPFDIVGYSLTTTGNQEGSGVGITTPRSAPIGTYSGTLADLDFSFVITPSPTSTYVEAKFKLKDGYGAPHGSSDWITVHGWVPPTLAPEPASLSMLGLGALALLRRRKR